MKPHSDSAVAAPRRAGQQQCIVGQLGEHQDDDGEHADRHVRTQVAQERRGSRLPPAGGEGQAGSQSEQQHGQIGDRDRCGARVLGVVAGNAAETLAELIAVAAEGDEHCREDEIDAGADARHERERAPTIARPAVDGAGDCRQDECAQRQRAEAAEQDEHRRGHPVGQRQVFEELTRGRFGRHGLEQAERHRSATTFSRCVARSTVARHG